VDQAAEVLPGDRRVVHHADAIVVSGEKATETREKIAKRFDFSADSYLYSTGRVRHVKADAPVVDDGCTMPEGGGFPGRSSGSEKIEPRSTCLAIWQRLARMAMPSGFPPEPT